MSQLTHINAAGEAHMVDVSGKAETVREARAEAYVEMQATTLAMIIDGSHHKGDVFATARIAGIQAAIARQFTPRVNLFLPSVWSTPSSKAPSSARTLRPTTSLARTRLSPSTARFLSA